MKEMTLNIVEHRPWGSFEILLDEPHTKVKRLVVLPQQRLSLQLHYKRQEHWVVTQGSPTIVVGETQAVYQTGDTIFIPTQTKHRISNLTQEPVELIEIQLGDYFGEDDIVRFEDDYDRV